MGRDRVSSYDGLEADEARPIHEGIRGHGTWGDQLLPERGR
jgi:hypothetical protein